MDGLWPCYSEKDMQQVRFAKYAVILICLGLLASSWLCWYINALGHTKTSLLAERRPADVEKYTDTSSSEKMVWSYRCRDVDDYVRRVAQVCLEDDVDLDVIITTEGKKSISEADYRSNEAIVFVSMFSALEHERHMLSSEIMKHLHESIDGYTSIVKEHDEVLREGQIDTTKQYIKQLTNWISYALHMEDMWEISREDACSFLRDSYPYHAQIGNNQSSLGVYKSCLLLQTEHHVDYLKLLNTQLIFEPCGGKGSLIDVNGIWSCRVH